MGEQALVPHTPGDPKTIEVDYQPRGYLTPEAVKVAGLAAQNIAIGNGTAGGKLVTGSVANQGTMAVPGPELYFFPLDSGGRPFDFGYDNSTMDIAPGSSWSFQITLPGPVNKYVAFPVFRQQPQQP